MGERKLVVIGNGMAGVRCVEEILKLAPDAFQITIFGKEPYPNYNRILLSKVLQGQAALDGIILNNWAWYEKKQITLYTGEAVQEVNTEEKWVRTEERTVSYDELIFATGSIPFMLPIPGANKEGVMAFRDIRDCQEMIDCSKKFKKAVVIGGGVLGLEAARGLLDLGMEVEVVHLRGNIMERQLDQTASEMLQKELETQGMNFLLGKSSAEITGDARVSGLLFSDGDFTEADLIIMAAGVRPNISLAQRTPINTNRGILVDDFMRTNIPHVHAVGECAEHEGTVYGLVAPLYEQGKILAASLCGMNPEGYHGSVLSTRLKVSGVDVFSAGEWKDRKDTQSILKYDGVENTYKKIVVRDGKVAGAVLFGDIQEGPELMNMIKNGQAYKVQETESDDDHFMAVMPGHTIICECNGVSKEMIVKAIKENKLETAEDIRICTRASSSCGGCGPLVSGLLEYVRQNGEAEELAAASICDCTAAGHEDVIRAIRGDGEHTAEKLMRHLNWKDEKGCDICRPALQYYLGIHGHSLSNFPAAKLGAIKISFTADNRNHTMLNLAKLGIHLKQTLEATVLPANVTLAIASNPGEQDFVGREDAGLMGAPSGWELVIKDTRLFSGLLEDEAVSMMAGLLKYYRKTAYYAEELAIWMNRMGIIQVREEIFKCKFHDSINKKEPRLEAIMGQV
ncbi:nitrite reductase large subunit NirB [Bacillus massiliglaciei]|uniref:nitrite reductase large subunit NirB n=1 Tax=Bacillus massiliglaciei TaxID=1816693 RepID=UPI000B2DB353|nr:nitrite reductase large subunit NirB [Bacillus massiliglaciei]